MAHEAKLILDHIKTKLRTVGHNNITRCRSCAEEGHDRSEDNVLISIEDRRKYYGRPVARET